MAVIRGINGILKADRTGRGQCRLLALLIIRLLMSCWTKLGWKVSSRLAARSVHQRMCTRLLGRFNKSCYALKPVPKALNQDSA